MTTRARSLVLLATTVALLASAAIVLAGGDQPARGGGAPVAATTTTGWSRPAGWPIAAGLPAVPLPWPVVQDEGGGGDPYRTGPAPDSPVVIPPPPLGLGDGTLYAIGDSVLEGIAPVLAETLAGWDRRIDALQGRDIPEGLALVEANSDRIGQVALIILGHNYGGRGEAPILFERLLDGTERAQRVVVVTVAEWSPSQEEVNQAIWNLAATHPEVVVADWSSVIKANPGFLRSDGVHLTPTGNIALANLVSVLVGPLPTLDGSAPPPPITLRLPPTTAPGPSISFVPPPSTWIDWSTPTTAAGPTTTATGPSPTTAPTTAPTSSTSSTVAPTSSAPSSTSTSSTSLAPPPAPPP